MQIQIVRPDESEIDELRTHFDYTISETFKIEGVYESHYDDYIEEVEYQLNQIKNDLASNGSDEYFLIAKSDGKIVGTIGYGSPNSVIKKYHTDELGEIKAVYINPLYQRKKVGSKLFASMISYLKSRHITHFVLDCGYSKSQTFWIKKLGEPYLFLKDYYAEDSHHMIWESSVDDLL